MSEQDAPLVATRNKKYEFIGLGCLLQAVGILLLFIFPIGTIAGIVLFIYGCIKAYHLSCSNCGNRISDEHVKICPTCHARFE